MPNTLNVRKAIQAIAVLLRSDRCDRMSYLRLLKLLYIADRESLAETGHPLNRDKIVAMKHGPVLSSVFYLVKEKHPEALLWNQHLRRDGYQLELIEDPGTSELSPYEIRKLREVAERYRDVDEWDVSEATHAFPEYQRNKPDEALGQKVRDIPLADVLAAVGREGDADRIAAEAAEDALLDRIFSR